MSTTEKKYNCTWIGCKQLQPARKMDQCALCNLYCCRRFEHSMELPPRWAEAYPQRLKNASKYLCMDCFRQISLYEPDVKEEEEE